MPEFHAINQIRKVVKNKKFVEKLVLIGPKYQFVLVLSMTLNLTLYFFGQPITDINKGTSKLIQFLTSTILQQETCLYLETFG